ncbi:MAG: DUF3579 domain-containing protein [Proteobacteria bacterium]|nr:DUF3579 domain-containing protein [Pseudomonadota bacterium]
MIRNLKEWVILGITLDGEEFVYPDWAERLCGMLAQQSGSNRLSHSDYLYPTHIDGLPAVVLNADLEQVDLESYNLVRQFAQDNNLKVRSGRTPEQLSATSKHPALNIDRRDLCARRGS